MTILIIDIGGSGIKIGTYDIKSKKSVYHKKIKCDTTDYDDMKHYHYKLENNLIKYINKNVNPQIIKYIGISTAGNIKPNNEIERWDEKYNIINKLNSLNFETFVMNDGDAHMYYCINKYSKTYFPAICVSFGTGIGFSVADRNGLIIKTTDEHFLLDHVQLSDNENHSAHSCLGQRSFNESLKTKDFTSYNTFVKRFLQIFSSFFLVKTIFICGGNSLNKDFKKNIIHKIRCMDFVIKNKINIIHIKTESALGGIGYYVDNQTGKKHIVFTHQII